MNWQALFRRGSRVARRSEHAKSQTVRGQPEIEHLEQRSLLSVVPVGPAFQILENPGFVPVAVDRGSIVARRYNAAGIPQGDFIDVDSGIGLFYPNPDVAMDADGDFVITWSSYQDGSEPNVQALRFNAAGVAQGSQFLVNTYTT